MRSAKLMTRWPSAERLVAFLALARLTVRSLATGEDAFCPGGSEFGVVEQQRRQARRADATRRDRRACTGRRGRARAVAVQWRIGRISRSTVFMAAEGAFDPRQILVGLNRFVRHRDARPARTGADHIDAVEASFLPRSVRSGAGM